jgi:hypothetical protein
MEIVYKKTDNRVTYVLALLGNLCIGSSQLVIVNGGHPLLFKFLLMFASHPVAIIGVPAKGKEYS